AKNTDSVWRVIPLNLQVPSEPPELAVRSLEPQDKLVLLYPRQKGSVEWKLLFPANLSDQFYYLFNATVRTLGRSEALTFKGKSSVEAQQQTQIELSDWFSLVKNNVLTLSFSIRNTGNTRADAELFVVLAGQSKALNISLEAGEAKTPSLDFEKPEGETASGEIQLIVGKQLIKQPIQISIPAEQPTPSAEPIADLAKAAQEDYLPVIAIAVLLAVLIVAALLVKRR
ncbi:MAG: hypothetical protein V1834_04850, partial [Candidatus Micrarchaeota archaeon]